MCPLALVRGNWYTIFGSPQPPEGRTTTYRESVSVIEDTFRGEQVGSEVLHSQQRLKSFSIGTADDRSRELL